MSNPSLRLIRRQLDIAARRPHTFTRQQLRPQSTNTTSSTSSQFKSTTPPLPQELKGPPQSRLDKLSSRLPSFLRSYLDPLRSAPLSHMTSFLILHEITALVPLIGFTALFHYASEDLLPVNVGKIREWDSFKEGTVRFERYLRKKGWIETPPSPQTAPSGTGAGGGGGGDDGSGTGEGVEMTPAANIAADAAAPPVQIVLELATAWAVTKLLLPLRLGLSVWATPWFARTVVVPCTRIFGAGKKATR